MRFSTDQCRSHAVHDLVPAAHADPRHGAGLRGLRGPGGRELKGDPNGVTRLRSGKAKIRRQSKRLTTFIGVAGLSLCFIASGCSSASSGASAGGGGSAAPATTSSCDSAAYQFHRNAAVPRGRPVLAAIQLPDPVEIPDPIDVINEARPVDEDAGTQEAWAKKENVFAESVANDQQQNQQDLQTVSNEVSADEVGTLLGKDLDALDAGDGEYDAQLCESIKDLNDKFGQALDYYAYLKQVTQYLNGLAVVLNSSAPKDLAKAINDAQNKFQQALGTCVDNLETISWIVEQIHNIFCGEGE
jgi:hypothetical protein